jgi:hypothetical protein
VAELPDAIDEIPGNCGREADVEVELGRDIGSRVGGGKGRTCGPSSITDRNGGRSSSDMRLKAGRGRIGARMVASLTVSVSS